MDLVAMGRFLVASSIEEFLGSKKTTIYLVGGFNPSFPSRVENKKYLKSPPSHP